MWFINVIYVYHLLMWFWMLFIDVIYVCHLLMWFMNIIY